MSGYPPQDDDYEYDAREAFGDDFHAEMSRDLTPQAQGGSQGLASPGMDGIRDGAPFDDGMYDDMERERAGTPSPMQPESSMGSASMGSTSGASSSLSPSDMDYSEDDAGSPLQDGSLLNSGFAGGPPQARDHMPTPPPPAATQEQDDDPGVGPSHGGSFDPSMFTTSVSPRPDDDEDDGYY
ncbi:hypothetical protein LTR56_002540 [Elasticomyces elasticus]|nr:hypothetical protein LTR22_019469 [Elasticomyces elasticus]KAK3657398.1 hypothetical protein LTR56_002540 [Elasticomyces elasticus]KAK4909445.1 hypothetical protein LTR49_021778 [Elasticomyces elasticus]KAK5750864.1 hypothetical protein LTS12_019075 [Elasticomyces elasticus]